MHLYATVRDGRLELRPLFADEPEIRVFIEERDRLVDYFVEKTLSGYRVMPIGGVELPDGWDGHIMCSSSVDFANEEQWPEESAHSFIENCVAEAYLYVGTIGQYYGPFIRFAMARRGRKWEQ